MVGIIRVAPGTSRDYNPTVLPLYCTRFVEHLPAEVAPDEVAESVAENLPAKFPAKFFHGCPHVSNRSRGRIVVFQSLDDFRSRLPPAFSVHFVQPEDNFFHRVGSPVGPALKLLAIIITPFGRLNPDHQA